jgi:hypothetical protein
LRRGIILADFLDLLRNRQAILDEQAHETACVG